VLQACHLLITDEGTNGLALHAINETARPITARLELTCFKDGRQAVIRRSRDVELAPRSAIELSAYELIGSFFNISYAYRFGPPGHDVTVAQLIATDSGEILSQALHHPLGYGHAFPAPTIAAGLVETADGPALALESDVYAPLVILEFDGHRPADNWLPLLPGQRRVVALKGSGAVQGTVSLPGGAGMRTISGG